MKATQVKFLPDYELDDGRKVKRFQVPINIQAKEKGFDPTAPMQFEGYANYATPDRGGEIMPPGCFDLKNYMLNPILLLDHNYSRPIGRTLAIEQKEDGLYIVGQLGDPGAGHELTPDQKIVRSLVAQKILNSMSVGFIPMEWSIDEKTDVLTYTKVELLEISIVSIPMQQNSQIVNVKSKKELEMTETDVKGEKPADDKPETNEAVEVLKSLANSMGENTEICKAIHKMLEEMKPSEKPKDDEPKDDEEKKALAVLCEQQKEYIKELEDRLDRTASILENQ